jgi:hypothetical protein
VTEYCKNKGCRFTREFCGCPEFGTGLTDKEKLAVAVEALEWYAGWGCETGRQPQWYADKARTTLKEIQDDR